MHFNRRVLSSVMLAVVSSFSAAQALSAADPERKQAFELMEQFKPLQALPLFADLAKKNPDDIAVHEAYGACLIADASGTTDDGKAKQERAHAYQVLQHAKQLGDNSDLLNVLLAGLSPDGSMPGFSGNQEVEQAMRQGEAAFARGDLDNAVAGYTHALLLDPKQYYAALFIGDVYFKKGDQGSAGEWFQRAIDIDPNIETAHRYWGDALSKLGRGEDARTQYVQAIVADPYNHTSWVGLLQWAKANGVTLSHPRIEPQSSAKKMNDKSVTVTIDPAAGKADDGSNAWLMYGLIRAKWQGEDFYKQFPKEKNYRHSLPEEFDALHGTAQVLRETMNSHKPRRLNPQLASLLKLDDEGLLQSYVLLAKPDDGIAQDYAAYRDAHRDLLIRYMQEYVAPLPNNSKLSPPQS